MRQSQRHVFAVLIYRGLSWLEEVCLKPINLNSCYLFKLLEVETASGGWFLVFFCGGRLFYWPRQHALQRLEISLL
ncbi:hypothetical protein Vadar_032996 [Vaccinium darrowii]|uniref:Uncharacterized protein n=1 Tax=Vaccinium darrowii TaxID=229202 RepID=A0ACB7ZP61_9ERIC|nr:hypothetical protein Vadar_032996 [Vaccinium darrowii]